MTELRKNSLPKLFGFLETRENTIKKVGYGFLIVSLLIFVLGLYFFLLGPDESVISFNTTEDSEVSLDHWRNETICVSPFESMGLIEPPMENLSELLINRNVSIHVQVVNGGKVDVYVMNSTRLSTWRNGSAPEGDFSRKGVNKTRITFSPRNAWQMHYLVLINPEDRNASVDIRVYQTFYLKVFNYDNALNWLKIAVLSGIPLFALQIPLKATPDDFKDKIYFLMVPKRYKRYELVEERPIPIFFTVIIMIVILCIMAVTHLCAEIDRMLIPNPILTIVGVLFKDYTYRFGIAHFLLGLLLTLMMICVLIFWRVSQAMLLTIHYPKLERYKKMVVFQSKLMKKLLVDPHSVMFYFFLGLMALFLFQTGRRNATILLVAFSVFCSYIVSQILNKTRKEFKLKAHEYVRDFKYIKGVAGSAIIASIMAFYSFYPILWMLRFVSHFVLDRSVLSSYTSLSCFPSWFEDICEAQPFIAYLIPLCMLVIYYSLVVFSRDHLPRKFLREFALEPIFFISVFGISIWLQSLYAPIKAPQVTISLISSLITSSFRNYLKVLESYFSK